MKFKPVSPDEVNDLALLPKRFDMFAGEMREVIKALSDKLIVVLERVEEKLDDLNHRVGRLERDQHRTDKRLADIERLLPKQRRQRGRP